MKKCKTSTEKVSLRLATYVINVDKQAPYLMSYKVLADDVDTVSLARMMKKRS